MRINMNKLSHLDERGQAHMVDVSAKADTQRIARAAGRIVMLPSTLEAIIQDSMQKGDVLAVARTAGIMAAKRTADLIPLCHALMLTQVRVDLTPDTAHNAVECRVEVTTVGQTGVEMEALTAVSVALLTVYDMCKAVDRGMRMVDIRVVEKLGGTSGHWRAA